MSSTSTRKAARKSAQQSRPSDPGGRGAAATSRSPVIRDRFTLYELAVQCVDADLDFCAKAYRRRNGTSFRILREDFCGTAALASAWVARSRGHMAVGVDLDGPTLRRALERNVKPLGAAASRLRLFQDDVRAVRAPKVDVVAALNFSYWVFKTRDALRAYLKAVRASLKPGGIVVLDMFGGTAAMLEETDRRRIAAERLPSGERAPPFTYVWEQEIFNPVDNHFRCHISFELKDGTRIERAFTYDWRFWTPPELRELLAEAGFADSDVWVDGWDEDFEEGDGVYVPVKRFDNEGCYIGYVVGYRDPHEPRKRR